MVDFRYHLVSIIAVFLALAVGIVLGTTTINGPALDTLNNRLEALTKDRDELRTNEDDLTRRLSDATSFGKAVLPLAVSGRLPSERVLIVSMPQASDELRSGVSEAVQAAGASIAGRVAITDKFASPDQQGTLEQVVGQVFNGSAVTGDGPPLRRASTQLATALATSTRDGSTGANAETDRVVSLFRDADLVAVDGDLPARSSVVMVIAARPAAKEVAGREDAVRAAYEVISALARQASAVVVVTESGGAEEGGVLSAVRGDRALATDVSTVDDVDTPGGQVAMVLAAVERLRSAVATGERPAAGHYGSGPGAAKPLPDPTDIS